MKSQASPDAGLAASARGWRANASGATIAATIWVLGLSYSVVSTDIPGVPVIDFRTKWLPLLLIALLLTLWRLRALTTVLRQVNLGMVLLLGWALLSCAWAPNPMHVISQAAAIIGVSLIGVSFCLTGWHPDRFIGLLCKTLTTILIASLIAGLAFPELAIHSETSVSLAGAWRGVTYQKNGLGQVAAIAVIVWTYRWAARDCSGRVATLGVALAILMLVLSRSSTSLMLALLASMAIIIMLRPVLSIGWLGRRSVFLVIVVLVPLSVYLAVATSFFGWVGNLFGKDGTFSGRTLIWDEIYLEIAKHPFLGIGYASFWGDYDSPSATLMVKLQWAVPSAHNGYLEIVNELGLIGLAFFIAFLVIHAIALGRLARFDHQRFALYMPLFLYLILANVSESGWMRPVDLTHLVGMYTSLEVSRLLLARDLYLNSLSRAIGEIRPESPARPPPPSKPLAGPRPSRPLLPGGAPGGDGR